MRWNCVFGIIALGLLLLSALTLSGCLSNGKTSGLATASASDGEKLKVGFQTSPISTLIIVAAEKGYFNEVGLDIELVEFSAGKFALQAFLANQVDFAVAGDVPIMLATMAGNDFYVIAQPIESSTENRIIALKDGTLANPKDYFSAKKRRLSTINGGTAEFYTYNFLKYYGVNPKQVEIIFQKPEDIVAGISSRSVDAISVFEPYPFIAEQKLAGQTLSFAHPPEVYSPLYVITAKKIWVNNNPKKTVAFLKALLKAQTFVEEKPAEAQSLVAKRSGFSLNVIKATWDSYTIKIALSDRLLQNWQAEAAWAIETGKVKPGEIPDFNKFVRRDLLDKARGEVNG